MDETILSAGIDVGTSTTQIIFSRMTIQNTGGFGSVPKIEIVDKEIIYESEIYFTPLLSENEIDGDKVSDIVMSEYKKANLTPDMLTTGAVIITGESSRKSNARSVTEALSETAGNFVVATAGPDLESVLAGKGSGAARLSEETGKTVANFDIGGGTTNICLFRDGAAIDTACLDIGGRLIKVDENGRVIDGDRIIAVLAKRMKEKKILKGDAAVVTVMSNLGFHDFMKQNGMKTVCAKVGDRYVLEEMQRSGYNIGGEQSGHIIMLDHATTGDGQLTAAMLIKVMTETGKSLAQLCEGIEDYPQLLVNVKITESGKGKWNKVPAIMDCISAAEKELGGSGRVLVRESGTEPLVRVMVEGKDMDMVKRLADSIAEEVKRSLT